MGPGERWCFCSCPLLCSLPGRLLEHSWDEVVTVEGEWRTEDHDIFLFSFVYILHVFTIFCFRGASLKKIVLF